MTATVYESLTELPAGCREPARNLVLACADTKLLLGYHYGEWTFGPPALEAAVTCCSLAQGEFGHVRLLLGVLRAAYGDDPEALVEGREPADFAGVPFLDRPITDWAGLVAANYVVDQAVTRVLGTLLDSGFKPLRSGLEKMIDEERYHAHHGRGWLRALSRGTAEQRARLGTRLGEALAAVQLWLGPMDEPEDQALLDAGVKRRPNTDVAADLAASVAADAEAAGVTVRDVPVTFSGWTARRRRGAGPGPDAEIIGHLHGTRNAIFKVA